MTIANKTINISAGTNTKTFKQKRSTVKEKGKRERERVSKCWLFVAWCCACSMEPAVFGKTSEGTLILSCMLGITSASHAISNMS